VGHGHQLLFCGSVRFEQANGLPICACWGAGAAINTVIATATRKGFIVPP
jgi:hypothetical protein